MSDDNNDTELRMIIYVYSEQINSWLSIHSIWATTVEERIDYGWEDMWKETYLHVESECDSQSHSQSSENLVCYCTQCVWVFVGPLKGLAEDYNMAEHDTMQI